MSDHAGCREYFEKLSELLDGELDRDIGERIARHLESCPQCRICWATFSKTVEVFHSWGPEPVPPGFVDELKDFIRKSLE